MFRHASAIRIFSTATASFLLALPGSLIADPKYDFESTAASILAGHTEGTMIVDGLPLMITAGLLSSTGDFVSGGAGATLAVVPPGTIAAFPEAGGLGVDSSIDPGASMPNAVTCPAGSPNHCTNQEGLGFDFDPDFVPTTLTLRTFGNVTGVHVFTAEAGGGPTRVPRSSRYSSGAGAEVIIGLIPGITSLSLKIATGTDPALFVASIGGRRAVPIDIEPRSCPSSLKLKGRTRVALLGTQEFDASQVDVASIRLAGVSPLRSSLRDSATPSRPFFGKSDPSDCTNDGRDGFLDLGLMFDAREIAVAIEDDIGRNVQDSEVFSLILEGELFDGTSIIGEDVIVVKKRGR